MWDIVSINWDTPLTPEQRMVVRNVAAHYLRAKKKAKTYNFKHPHCEGKLTRKEEGSFGTFSGTIFVADLGMEGGEPQTYQFLIPRNSEWLPIDDDTFVASVKPIPGGDFGVKKVDVRGTSYIADK